MVGGIKSRSTDPQKYRQLASGPAKIHPASIYPLRARITSSRDTAKDAEVWSLGIVRVRHLPQYILVKAWASPPLQRRSLPEICRTKLGRRGSSRATRQLNPLAWEMRNLLVHLIRHNGIVEDSDEWRRFSSSGCQS